MQWRGVLRCLDRSLSRHDLPVLGEKVRAQLELLVGQGGQAWGVLLDVQSLKAWSLLHYKGFELWLADEGIVLLRTPPSMVLR